MQDRLSEADALLMVSQAWAKWSQDRMMVEGRGDSPWTWHDDSSIMNSCDEKMFGKGGNHLAYGLVG